MEPIARAWRGQERLWKVFWLYNFLLGSAVIAAIDAVPAEQVVLVIFILVTALAWAVWVGVSLWRCAFNSSWRGWGYIARGLVVLSVFLVCIGIFVPLV